MAEALALLSEAKHTEQEQRSGERWSELLRLSSVEYMARGSTSTSGSGAHISKRQQVDLSELRRASKPDHGPRQEQKALELRRNELVLQKKITTFREIGDKQQQLKSRRQSELSAMYVMRYERGAPKKAPTPAEKAKAEREARREAARAAARAAALEAARRELMTPETREAHDAERAEADAELQALQVAVASPLPKLPPARAAPRARSPLEPRTPRAAPLRTVAPRAPSSPRGFCGYHASSSVSMHPAAMSARRGRGPGQVMASPRSSRGPPETNPDLIPEPMPELRSLGLVLSDAESRTQKAMHPGEAAQRWIQADPQRQRRMRQHEQIEGSMRAARDQKVKFRTRMRGEAGIEAVASVGQLAVV